MIPLLVVAGTVGAAVAVNAFEDNDSKKSKDLCVEKDTYANTVTHVISEDEVPAHIRKKILEKQNNF